MWIFLFYTISSGGWDVVVESPGVILAQACRGVNDDAAFYNPGYRTDKKAPDEHSEEAWEADVERIGFLRRKLFPDLLDVGSHWWVDIVEDALPSVVGGARKMGTQWYSLREYSLTEFEVDDWVP
jgi:hypothetical protein